MEPVHNMLAAIQGPCYSEFLRFSKLPIYLNTHPSCPSNYDSVASKCQVSLCSVVNSLSLLWRLFVYCHFPPLRVMTIMGAIPNCVRVLEDVLNGLASVSVTAKYLPQLLCIK